MRALVRVLLLPLAAGCVSHDPPAPELSPAFDATVQCVVATMQSGMFLETSRGWVLRNSELRGGALERDPTHPELSRDHMVLRFASSTDGEQALIRVFGREPGAPIQVNVGPIVSNTKGDQLRRRVMQACARQGP